MSASVCRSCGHREPGVCVLFFGHRCVECGAVDAAKLVASKADDNPAGKPERVQR